MSQYNNDKKPESVTEESDVCASDPEVNNNTADSADVFSNQPSSVLENQGDILKIDHQRSVQSNISSICEPSIPIIEHNLEDLNLTDTTSITYNITEDDHASSEQSEKVNENTYELEKYTKNIMIIFNHELFMADDSRTGTNLDVVALKNTFKQFRFKVTTHKDLEEKDIFEKLDKFSEQNFAEYGCVCVAILTHGNDYGQLSAFDSMYSEERVFKCFDEEANESLRGKPIIFLIQACRGAWLARRVGVPQRDRPAGRVSLDRADRNEGRYFLPTEANIIIFHSCFFGRASARIETKGTWFIQTICEQLLAHADHEHVEKIFRRVKRVIALEKVLQMPVTSSTLLRKLFLKRNEQVNRS